MRRNTLFRILAPAALVLGSLGIQVAPALAAPAGAAPTVITVNLGDSYASGEGGTPYLTGSDTATDQCHRSTTNPAQLVNQAARTDLRDLSCSGATTTSVVTTGQYGEGSQVSRIPANAKVVYLTIGGNDGANVGAGFSNVLGCYLVTDCDQTSVPAGELSYINTQLGNNLATVYAAVKAKAPHATVVVGSYPQLFPAPGSAPTSSCPYMNAAEINLGNQIVVAANGVIKAKAQQYGFKVTDPTRFFKGHDLCAAPADTYFYLPGTPGLPLAAYAHPNISGRQALAAAGVLAGATG